MKIRFYIDPICPWCWITSRWMTQVATQRDLEIEFCSFSLAAKNDVLDDTSEDGYGPAARMTHGLLRVIEKIKQDCGEQANDLVAKFYTEIGKRLHVESSKNTDWLVDVLVEIGLDKTYAKAENDKSYDIAIKKSIELALETVGDDVGVPIMILETPEGDRGFFGPVIAELPTMQDSLKLYDGISTMISLNAFYELKRTREVGPDVQSTALLFPDTSSEISGEGDACPIF